MPEPPSGHQAGHAAGGAARAEHAPGSAAALLLSLLALLAVAGYAAAERALVPSAPGFPLDDAWIHLQFARSLAQGEGLAYNPGEPVAGSTAPLWTALLALGFLLPGGPVLWAKALGALLHAAGVDATRRLGLELGLSPPFAALAAVLVLSTHWLVWSALSGMEVPLFVALGLWGMVLHLRERRDAAARPPLALPVLALAALARPEGVLLLLLAVMDRLLVPRRSGALRRLAAGLGLAALVAAPVILVYGAIGGSVLPTTFAAKSDGLSSLLPDPRYLYTVLGILFQPQPWMTLAAGAGALALAARLGTVRDAGLLPALWVLALPLAYSAISGSAGSAGGAPLVGNFGRYFFPLFPPLVVLGVLGLEPAARHLAGLLPRGGRLLGAALAAVVLAPTLVTLASGAPRYARSVANVQDSDVLVARWLAPRLPAAATLAVQDIGAIKYFLPNRVLDLSAIVSPEVKAYVAAARSADDPRGARGMRRWLEERRPDYLIVFPKWFPELAGDRRLFRPLARLPIPGNITMADDEIVIYETIWNRYPLRSPGP